MAHRSTERAASITIVALAALAIASVATAGPAGASASLMPVFDPASPQTRAIEGLFVKVLVISAVIFTVMAALIAIAIVRFRARGGALPEQDEGSHRAEIAWMVGPIVIVLLLAAISAKLVLAINVRPKADPPDERPAGAHADLEVTGRQWWWEVRYTASGAIAANEIHIPTGKQLRVLVQSADVAHCFWVPRLARKIDAIPGRSNFIWLEADAPGEYQGYCAEFCGTQHAWMRFKVFAHPQAEFDAWIDAQLAHRAQLATGSAGALASEGERLFRSLSCVDCHRVGGVDRAVAVGPDLTHLSGRTTLGGGVIANSPQNLASWLRNPQAIKPGSKMPNFNLTEDQVAALVAFLGEGGAAPPQRRAAAEGRDDATEVRR